MTIESVLATVLDKAPNLIVAFLMLWWQRTTIDKLLEHQRTLIDRLLQMAGIAQAGEQAVFMEKLTKPRPPGSTVGLSMLPLLLLLLLFLFM